MSSVLLCSQLQKHIHSGIAKADDIDEASHTHQLPRCNLLQFLDLDVDTHISHLQAAKQAERISWLFELIIT